jgi:hypothetical protein
LDRAPIIIYTSTKCDLFCAKFHRNSPKGPREIAKTAFLKEKAKFRGHNSSKIIGQGSPYNMHIYHRNLFLSISFDTCILKLIQGTLGYSKG